MKKLHLTLGFILLNFALNAFADFHPCDFDVYVPNFKGGIKFGAGVLYLRPDLPQADFAVTTEDVFEYNTLSPNYGDWSYEVGVGYDFACTGNDVRLNYFNLDQDDAVTKERGDGLLFSSFSDLTNIPRITDTDTFIFPGPPVTVTTATASGPLFNQARVGFIQAKIHPVANQLDLEFGQSIHVTPILRLRFYGGLRGAKLRSDFDTTVGVNSRDNQRIILSGTAINPTGLRPVLFHEAVDLRDVLLTFRQDINHRSNYSGFGPRFGMDANYYLDTGVSFFGAFSSSVLVGEINSALNERATTKFSAIVADALAVSGDPTALIFPTLAPGDPLTENSVTENNLYNPNRTRIVPNLEAKIGLSYSPCLPCTCSRVFIEAGYMVNHYFNAVERLSEVSSTSDLPTHTTMDLSFDGVYLKLEMHA